MIKELVKLATHLDERGLTKEADYLDVVIKRASAIDPMEPGFDPGPPRRSSLQDLDLGSLDADEIILGISRRANKELRELLGYKAYGHTEVTEQINRAKNMLEKAINISVNTPIFEGEDLEYIKELLAGAEDNEVAARNLYELISPIDVYFWESIDAEVRPQKEAYHNEGEKLELIREVKSLLKLLTETSSSPMAEGLSNDINAKLIRLERMEQKQ